MNVYLSWLVFAVFSLGVFLWTRREYANYCAEKFEIGAYSQRRLQIRICVSLLVWGLAFLLLVARHFLHPKAPMGLVLYSVVVILGSVGLVVLAWLDWKETRRMFQEGKRVLREELIETLKQESEGKGARH